MRKFLTSVVVCQLCLSSCPISAHAALTNEPPSDQIPVSRGFGETEKALNTKIELTRLSEEGQPAAPIIFTAPTDPFGTSSLKFSLDREQNKVTFEPFPGQSYEASLNSKTNTAVITFPSITTVTSTMTLKFKTTASGGLTLASVAISLSQMGGMTSIMTHVYSATGEYTGLGVTLTGPNVWQSIGFNKASDSSWSVVGRAMDMAARTFSFYNNALSLQDLKDCFASTPQGMVQVLDRQASVKTVIDWNGTMSLIQSEKNESGAWVARHKSLYNATTGEYQSYVVDQGVEKLFIQSQTVSFAGDSFTATYGQSDLNARGPISLTLKSATKTYTVHYPATDILEVDGKKYQIVLGADGKMRLKEYFYDLNNDALLNEADVELLAERIKTGVFGSEFDLNSDRVLDNKDLAILTDRYIEELKKVATVFIVNPGESIALAQEKARLVIAAGLTKDLHVLIKSGDYYNTHLEFDARDSGQNGFKVLYRGMPGQELPKLMGGVALPQTMSSTTWTRVNDMPGNVYKINVAAYGLNENSFAGLFVDGVAAMNATSEDKGMTQVDDMPATNLIPQYYPDHKVIAIGDGTGKATKVGTYIGDPNTASEYNNSPSWEEEYPIDISYVKINPALGGDLEVNWKTVISLYSNDKTTLLSSATRIGRWDRAQVINEYKSTFNMKATTLYSYQAFKFKAGDFPADFDYANGKVHYWCSGTSVQEIKIKAVVWDSADKTSGTIILDDVFGHGITKTLQADGTYKTLKPGREVLAGGALGNYIIGHEFSIKNSKSMLSEGEFYYDGAGRLYYSVPSGKSLTNLKITLPTQRNIIKVEGKSTDTTASPVHDVIFDRLDLSMTQVNNQLKDMYNGVTSSFGTFTPQDMAAVYLHNTENVTLKNSKIHNTGATGVSIYGHAVNVQVSNNEIAFTGSDGIVLNGDDVRMMNSGTDLPRNFSHHNQIVFNHIHDVGVHYEETMGIYLVQSGNNLIAQNAIDHVSYNGMYIIGLTDAAATKRGLDKKTRDRYSWNYASDNKIIGNDFSHVNLKMDDGGAIYSIESGKNNEIANNKFHDIYSGVRYEGGNVATFAIYLDCGLASYFNIHDNLFFNFNSSTSMPMNVNGSFNVIKNNTFIQNNVNYAIQFKEAVGNEDNVLENNLFINNHPNGKRAFKVRLYNQIRVPTTEAAAVPANAFKVKEWNTASPTGYSYYLYYYSKQLKSSDNNVFYNKSGIYNVEVNYFDIYEYVMTPTGPVKVLYQQGIIPFSQWKSQIVKGLTVQHDVHSVIASAMPVLNADLTVASGSPYYGKGARTLVL